MISGNGIAGPGAQEIAQALHTNDKLEELQVPRRSSSSSSSCGSGTGSSRYSRYSEELQVPRSSSSSCCCCATTTDDDDGACATAATTTAATAATTATMLLRFYYYYHYHYPARNFEVPSEYLLKCPLNIF